MKRRETSTIPPVVRFAAADVLPWRYVRPFAAPGRAPSNPPLPPSWWDTGSVEHPFNFVAAMARLTDDIAQRLPHFAHIDISRILFGYTAARSPKLHGLQARVTPLRFRGGALVRQHRGVRYQVQRFLYEEREMLYLVSFCLPRFLDRDFDDKMVTLFHELQHISPAFDGDLRRHGGRYDIHTGSQKEYDAQMARLAREYLNTRPDPRRSDFLRLNFAQLRRRHGEVIAVKLPRPMLVPVV